jgi:cystathionine beta-synthase
VLLPDGGRGYLSKIFSDRWMQSHGFLDEPGDDARVGSVLAGASRSAFPHVRPEHTVAEAVAALREHGLPAVPVVTGEPPVKSGEVAASVSERGLLDLLATGGAAPSDRVGDHLERKLPQVGLGQSVRTLRSVLAESPVALVLDDGDPVGVLGRADLLTKMTV